MPGLNEANLSEKDMGWTIYEYCRLLPSDAGYIKGARSSRLSAASLPPLAP